jgi:hypothetical protein
MSGIASGNVGRFVRIFGTLLRRGIQGKALSLGRFGILAGAAVSTLAACSGPGAGTGSAALVAAPPAIAVPQPGHPQLEVAQLASLETLSTAALIARLGEPDFTRRDPPAEIWQYRGATCVLDIFLYPEAGEMRVLHAATRDRDRLEAPENRCTPFGPTRAAADS